MDQTISEQETSAKGVILDFLSRNPIQMSPWKIAQFFENDANISEEYLDMSLDKLEDISPEFEENHRQLIEELEKATLLAVPMFRKLPLITILSIVRESTSSSQVFKFLPEFPKSPAPRLLDHIFRDEALTIEEKKSKYEKIAKSTSTVLGHLVSWRDHVAKYLNGLEKFSKDYDREMSDEQKEHLNVLLERSRNLIPQINKKIEQKKEASIEEIREFEQFYRVVSKETKYSDLDEEEARNRIQQVFDDTDEDLRKIIARMGKEIKEEVTEGINIKVEAHEEEEEDDSMKMSRKRTAGDRSNGTNGTLSSPKINSSAKKSKPTSHLTELMDHTNQIEKKRPF